MPKTPPSSIKIVDPEEMAYKNVLIFGTQGAGKTRMLGTAGQDDRTSPILVIATEPGTHSLVGAPGVKTVRITKMNQLQDTFNWLASGDSGFRAVAVDSITELHHMCIADRVDASKISHEEYVIHQQDFGTALNQMRYILRQFRALPMHVFFTALTKTEMRASGRIAMPALFGQMADEATGMFDACVYLAIDRSKNAPVGEDGDPVRTLILKNNPNFAAKVRTKFFDSSVDAINEITRDTPIVTELFDLWEVPHP